MRVLIAGAGISGLSLGWYLQSAGVDFQIYEAQSETGGCIKTKQQNDYLIECGPTTLQKKDQELWKLIQALKLESEVIESSSQAKKRYIVRKGKLISLPTKPGEVLTSKFLSTSGKIRFLKDLFLPKSSSSGSVFDFVSSRLGIEAAEYLLDPFVSGVYAGNSRALSFEAAFPKLFAAAQIEKSLILSAFKLMSSGSQKHGLYSFRSGLQSLTNEISRRLTSKIILSAEILSCNSANEGFVVMTKEKIESFSHVVLTVPALVSAKIIGSLDASTAHALESLAYPPLVSVFTSFKREQISHALDGFGFLSPSKENRFVLGSIWNSSLFQGRVKPGEVGLTAMVGGVNHPERTRLPDQKLIEGILKDYQELLGLEGSPTHTTITRWERAIPQYNSQQLGCSKALEELEARFPGLYISGNLRGGVSIGACVQEAQNIFQRILARSA